ncbi:hypothetical protein PITCH_A230110 [uncultured Desulfobacterium sp.]|uniref:Uncharacterized protein n=1 Tax=uncultured Desulfobacterium sp. TaxID=201089 RepID=A0A445MY20_9BACT|nr:hypothetical protein PITCH_A230110 [uncultured Desulfobacterium sp.]
MSRDLPGPDLGQSLQSVKKGHFVVLGWKYGWNAFVSK